MKHDHSNIKKAKKYLDNNNCIGIPTETVYGLAGNAYSNKAVKKIFSLKKRPKNNPLIVHYYNLSQLKKDCVLNKDFVVKPSIMIRYIAGAPINYDLNTNTFLVGEKYRSQHQKHRLAQTMFQDLFLEDH